MRNVILAIVAAATLGGTALADAGALKAGTMVVSADGKRIGRIERIVTDAQGNAQTASIIYDSRFVYVPVSTITTDASGRAVTSLSRKEVSTKR